MNPPQIVLPEDTGPKLAVPKRMSPTATGMIEELKITIRKKQLLAVGLTEIDSATVNDRDVKFLVAAEQKRQRRRLRNRQLAAQA